MPSLFVYFLFIRTSSSNFNILSFIPPSRLHLLCRCICRPFMFEHPINTLQMLNSKYAQEKCAVKWNAWAVNDVFFRHSSYQSTESRKTPLMRLGEQGIDQSAYIYILSLFCDFTADKEHETGRCEEKRWLILIQLTLKWNSFFLHFWTHATKQKKDETGGTEMKWEK